MKFNSVVDNYSVRSSASAALSGRRCDMLKDGQDLFEFITLESPLSSVFAHHDDDARRFAGRWIDFWTVAENIVGIEI